jgi:CBS domain containing-hemolysin-like protein
METDSTLPWLFLGLSAVGFWLAATVDASLSTVSREKAQALYAQGVAGSRDLESLLAWSPMPGSALSPLKFLFMASGVLSGVALSVSWWDTNWWLATPMSGAVAVLMGLLQLFAMAVAASAGESIALRCSGVAWAMSRLLAPLYSVVSGLRLWRRSGSNGHDDASQDEMSADPGISQNGDGEPLDEREARMIRGVVQLDQTTAREIMVPRLDILAAEIGVSTASMSALMVESGHSRVPVYEDNLDRILGIAYARDILGQLNLSKDNSGQVTSEVMRPVLFIPESKTLEELLNEFQELRVQMAIVVDEYGGVAGLVTIEDLLEEIVGEINDEFDIDEPEVQPVGKDEFLLDAGVSLDYLQELLQVTVEGNGFDTVGGLVYQRLGRIPATGDAVEYNGLRIKVMSTVGRRLKRLHVSRIAAGWRERPKQPSP